MFDAWLTYLSDNDLSMDGGDSILASNADIQRAIKLSRALLQNCDIALKLYSPVMQLLNPTINETQMRTIIDKVVGRGFNIMLEIGESISDRYMICSPTLDLDTSRATISFNMKYVQGLPSIKRVYLHFVKFLHEVGNALTPFVMTANRTELQDLSHQTDPNPNVPFPENVGTVWFHGRYIANCGGAVEETIFGGRVIGMSNTTKWYNGDLAVQSRKFVDLPLGNGNRMEYKISDEFMTTSLLAVETWASICDKTIDSFPSLSVPLVSSSLIAGDFAASREQAQRKYLADKKRKRTKTGGHFEEDSDDGFDEDSEEYRFLVSEGLALTSAQYRRRCQEGAKF